MANESKKSIEGTDWTGLLDWTTELMTNVTF